MNAMSQPDRRASSDRDGAPPLDAEKTVRRWRMVLGRYAESALPRWDDDAGLDETLGYLYDREYTGRGLRHGRGVGSGGGLGASALRAVDWLDGARRLFPASTLQRLESDALTRYGLTELLADPFVVDSIETSPELSVTVDVPGCCFGQCHGHDLGSPAQTDSVQREWGT